MTLSVSPPIRRGVCAPLDPALPSVSEVGVGDFDEGLSPFPQGPAGKGGDAVFGGDHVDRVGQVQLIGYLFDGQADVVLSFEVAAGQGEYGESAG